MAAGIRADRGPAGSPGHAIERTDAPRAGLGACMERTWSLAVTESSELHHPLSKQWRTRFADDGNMTHFTADAPNLPHRDHYDVVVVGARAAGASTAMLLARHGLSVLAIDRGRYGADIMSTHSLARAGVLQLSRWGLLDRIRAAGTPATRQVVFDYGGDEVAIDISSRGDVDGLYNPRRTVLDPILVDAARDAGAEVLHGVSMRRLVRDGNGRVAGVLIDAGGDFACAAACAARIEPVCDLGQRALHFEQRAVELAVDLLGTRALGAGAR